MQGALWPELIEEWRLTPGEVDYINRQQCLTCTQCGANLRAMTLARAIMGCYCFSGVFDHFIRSRSARRLRVLEINTAAALHGSLQTLPHHRLANFPDVDMMNLPFGPEKFDLVVHSDTLEHVPDPIQGLKECHRVLKPGGFCAFTIPIIVDRLSRTREGLSPSYHGSPSNPEDCLVHTEYGADAWKQLLLAGFKECRVFALEFPSSLALVGVK